MQQSEFKNNLQKVYNYCAIAKSQRFTYNLVYDIRYLMNTVTKTQDKLHIKIGNIYKLPLRVPTRIVIFWSDSMSQLKLTRVTLQKNVC